MTVPIRIRHNLILQHLPTATDRTGHRQLPIVPLSSIILNSTHPPVITGR
ncbi:MAG: hypothetical protein OXF02_04520 [Simkaniaceae bacterium]|nr:hypothetical protein [Simkaniaceae bacterium]